MSVVTDAMVGDAWEAYSQIEDEPPNLRALKAALAAVAPLIAARERERCAVCLGELAEMSTDPDDIGVLSDAAAAIRALGDTP